MNVIGPYNLTDYRSAPKSKGIYVVGSKFDAQKPITRSFHEGPYFNWCPINFVPRYAGISESKSSGMRGRLSCHARSKGSKRLTELLKSGETLWYICIEGEDKLHYEALFLCFKGGNQFDCNIRNENSRSGKREHQKVRNAMTPRELDFIERLDMGEHGNGM